MTNASSFLAVQHMEELIRAESQRCRAIYIVNTHTLNLAADDPEFRAVLNQADVVFGDGTGVRWAARMQGSRIIANLVGTDLLPLFFANTGGRGYRHYLLGGHEAVVAAAVRHLTTTYPQIDLVGYHHGHFSPAETGRVIENVNATAPDLLMVAMGSPVQERWIHDHRDRLKAKLCIGGLVDHWGGVLTRAPRWVRRNGFEWVQLMLLLRVVNDLNRHRGKDGPEVGT